MEPLWMSEHHSNLPDAPDTATLCISRHCPHCAAMLAQLADLIKAGRLGRLEIINVEMRPEEARARGVRSVPWLAIGQFELTGRRTRAEIETWIDRAGRPDGMADYFHALLKEGDMGKVLAMIGVDAARLSALLPIVGNPDASLNVRVGAGAVFEDYAGSTAIRAIVPELVALSGHADARVRADACHLLCLTRDPSVEPALRAHLDDPDADVREIAQESLDALSGG